MADQLPNLVAMMAEVAHDDPDSTLGWCDDQFEFEFAAGSDPRRSGEASPDRLRQTPLTASAQDPRSRQLLAR